jgi:adenosylmethionine-8-amino-7-oxononanoate aminotransferase
MPLGATIIAPKIVQQFLEGERAEGSQGRFFHSHSFTGHPLACAVALANEKLLADSSILADGDRIGCDLERELAPLRSHPRVTEVRRLGSVVAVETAISGGYFAAEVENWKRLALQQGVLLRPLGNVLYALPPLQTSAASLARIAQVIRECVDAIRRV